MARRYLLIKDHKPTALLTNQKKLWNVLQILSNSLYVYEGDLEDFNPKQMKPLTYAKMTSKVRENDKLAIYIKNDFTDIEDEVITATFAVFELSPNMVRTASGDISLDDFLHNSEGASLLSFTNY